MINLLSVYVDFLLGFTIILVPRNLLIYATLKLHCANYKLPNSKPISNCAAILRIFEIAQESALIGICGVSSVYTE